MGFELGDKYWKSTIGDGLGAVSRFTVIAGDESAAADCILRAGKRFKTPAGARVRSRYEAGRDGWWLHRWLCELGVDNVVVDSASIDRSGWASSNSGAYLMSSRIVVFVSSFLLRGYMHLWRQGCSRRRRDHNATYRQARRQCSVASKC